MDTNAVGRSDTGHFNIELLGLGHALVEPASGEISYKTDSLPLLKNKRRAQVNLEGSSKTKLNIFEEVIGPKEFPKSYSPKA